MGRTKWLILAAIAGITAPGARAQEKEHVCPPGPPPQPEVDRAVEKGVNFLRQKTSKVDWKNDIQREHTLDELVLAALVYGGLSEKHEDVQRLLKKVLDRPPRKTYETVLLCVALDKLDPVFYLWKLVECGQFLLDAQCENGQWAYSNSIAPPPKTKKLMKELKAWGAEWRKARGTKPASLRIELKAQPHKWHGGDNSNTQFAALGLWLCARAGIRFPKERVELARQWWLMQQGPEGAWKYGGWGGQGNPAVAMTAGGIGALRALQSVLETESKDPRAGIVAQAIEKGTRWLTDHFSFRPRWAVHYMREPYTHYSIERAGILCGVESFGPHPWYAEGALDLLGCQEPDGAWRLSRRARNETAVDADEDDRWAVVDTAMAILFFKKSVPAPVATGVKPSGK